MTLVAERLRVSVIAGADIKTALSAAKELAGMSSMIVEFEYDGTTVRVAADTNIDQLEKDWQKARERRPPLPFTIGPRPPSGSPLLTRKREVSKTARIGRFLIEVDYFTEEEIDRIWDALPGVAQAELQAEIMAEAASKIGDPSLRV